MVTGFRAASTAAQTVWAQLVMRGGGRKSAGSKRSKIGTGSDLVDRMVSDYSKNYGACKGQAKARSNTRRWPTTDIENRVYTLGVLTSVKPSAVAWSK